MPFTTEYKNGCLYRNWSGVVSSDELFESIVLVKRDILNGLPADKALYDFSETSKIDITNRDIRKYSVKCIEIARLSPNVKAAVVAPSDLIFGLARMWEMQIDENRWHVKVFRSRELAESWLTD